MAKPPVPEKVDHLLSRPNPSVISTVRPDGQPVSVATWYVWDNGRILVNMDEGRKRLEYMRRNPRVTLTVLAADDWYTHVSLQGTVAEITDDPELVDIDRLAQHYTGAPYHVRDRHRISAWIDVQRWHGWGATENTDVVHH
ncbi:PPOX class F420-dependent oxidoreductase [Salinifilum aidingensis]